jgi:hypothetical protein
MFYVRHPSQGISTGYGDWAAAVLISAATVDVDRTGTISVGQH